MRIEREADLVEFEQAPARPRDEGPSDVPPPLEAARQGDACPPARTIGESLVAWAAKKGSAPALLELGGRVLTSAELADGVRETASALSAAGIGRRDRVGLLVPPGIQGGQLVLGIACHCVLVPLNPAMTASELADACKLMDLAALAIADRHGADLLAAVPPGIAVLQAREGSAGGCLELRRPAGAAPATPGAVAKPAGGDVAFILRSSGTTGAPKLIPVTHANMVAMADRLGGPAWFAIGEEDRAVCTQPLYYAAGLKTALVVPLLLGASVAFLPPGLGTALAQWMDRVRPTYLSVAPGTLAGMLDRQRSSGERFDARSLRFVMCSSAYLPDELRCRAEALFGVPVLEFFGLTEAGVMAANPAPPGLAKPGTVGLPVANELRIVDESGAPVACGEVGEIVISGPTLTPGYMATGAAEPEPFPGGWLATGDLGRFDQDGYLSIAGRRKEVINRGGEKVMPYEVERALLEHPAVLEAAAFGAPHPRLGEHVAAAVVLRPHATVEDTQELRNFVAARLSPFKVPDRVELVDRLPRGDTGKVVRRVLAQMLSESAALRKPPHELLEFELLSLWRRLLRREEIGIDDDFIDVGGDSLLAVEMLMEVEALSGRPYAGELAQLTIRKLVQVLASGFIAEEGIVTQVRSGPGAPLFFCHGDYGSRGLYAHKLAAFLPASLPLYLLHCGPSMLEDCSSMEEIASLYAEEVARLAGRSRVLVGGYCNGGLAAWHLAHLLRARGMEVLEVLLVETPSYNAGRGLAAAASVARMLGTTLPGAAAAEGMAHAWRVVRKGVPGAATLALERGTAAVLRRRQRQHVAEARHALEQAGRLSLRRMAAYVPRPLDVGVTCFVADNGVHADTQPSRWCRLAPRVRTVGIPGTHHTAVVSERPALGRALSEAIARASSARSP